MRLLRRLRYLIRHRHEARQLAEDLELHRAMAEEAGRADGLSDREAQMALGAGPGKAIRAILARHARGFGFGLLTGIALAALSSRAIESQLYGVSRFDPLSYGGVLFALLLTGAVASVVPALRATRTDSLTTLRHE